MNRVNSILNQKIEKESELNSDKLNEVCPKCGKHLYKKYNILNKERIIRISCECESKAYKQKQDEDLAREKQIRLEKLITNSLMDKKFKQSTFENWDFKKGTKQMHELGKRYVANFKKCKDEGLGLLIHGDPGNGKTYLASAIANELLINYIPVICVSISGLLSRIQQTYNKWGKEAEADVIRGLCNADLLIIDDLGAEKRGNNPEWSISMIYNIIDSRYRSKLPLIITSNLKINPKETDGILADMYYKRTEDRILEMCTPILNSAKSIRIEEAKRKTGLLKEILYS